jgi:thiol-disulfide isomerase/thioredoxin
MASVDTIKRRHRSILRAWSRLAPTMVLQMALIASRPLPRLAALRRWLMIAPVLAGLCALAAPGTADDGKPGGSTTFVARADSVQSLFSLPSLDGPAHELARLRGRVVLVHFFATWCEPCRAEMASLKELQSRLGGRPFAIVPISVAETDGAVRRFFADDPLPFAILLDRDRSLARAWNIQTLPSTVVLDRALKSRFIAEGDVDWGRPDVMNMLADLLMEVPG